MSKPKSETVRAQLKARAIRIAAYQAKQRAKKVRSPSPKLIAVPANPVRSTRRERNEDHRNRMEGRTAGRGWGSRQPDREPVTAINFSAHPKGEKRTAEPRRSIWPARRSHPPTPEIREAAR